MHVPLPLSSELMHNALLLLYFHSKESSTMPAQINWNKIKKTPAILIAVFLCSLSMVLIFPSLSPLLFLAFQLLLAALSCTSLVYC